MTLAKSAKARLPCSLRVPKLILRAITQWRKMRSAALLVKGKLGSSRGRTIAAQSLTRL